MVPRCSSLGARPLSGLSRDLMRPFPAAHVANLDPREDLSWELGAEPLRAVRSRRRNNSEHLPRIYFNTCKYTTRNRLQSDWPLAVDERPAERRQWLTSASSGIKSIVQAEFRGMNARKLVI